MDRVDFWRGRRFAVGVALASVLVSALVSFDTGYLLPYPHAWLVSRDAWTTTASAQYLSFGGLGSIYSVNPFYSALPGFLMVLAPVAAIGDHLHLVIGYPFPLARPSMWLVVGPFFFVCGATAVPTVDYLAQTLGITARRRRVLSVLTASLISFPTAALFGHPEDVLAIGLACLSLAWFLQGRAAGAAVWLSLAVMMQTWAGLLIPLVVAATPAGCRLRTALRAAALPASVGVTLLVLDWRDASTVLLHQPMTGLGQHLPWWGLAGHVTTTQLGYKLVAVNGSQTRSAAVVVALVMGWYVHRDPTPERLIQAAAVALLARGLSETEFWPYYLAPAAVFLAVNGGMRTSRSTKRFTLALVGAGLLYLSAPLSYQQVQYPAVVALGVLAACGALCLAASRPPATAAAVPSPVLAQAG